ncbi:hypothetical protein MAHJHV59_49490 [Mycobacterium avium subsp. hominissuis]
MKKITATMNTMPATMATHAAPYRTPRVFQVAAWVAIVAGIVFIVAVMHHRVVLVVVVAVMAPPTPRTTR